MTGNKITPLARGSRIGMKAKPGERFELIDEQTGKAPEDLKATRVGNDLGCVC